MSSTESVTRICLGLFLFIYVAYFIHIFSKALLEIIEITTIIPLHPNLKMKQDRLIVTAFSLETPFSLAEM